MSVSSPPTGSGPGLPADDVLRIAEYSLGLLPEDQCVTLVGRLVREPRLRDELAFWEESWASLAEEIAPVAPSVALKRRVESVLFQGDEVTRGRRGGSFLSWAVAGLSGAVAAAALLFASPDLLRGPEPPRPMLVSEIAAEDNPLRVLAAYDANRGGFRVERTSGDPAAGRSLELWAIGAEGIPVSLGVLPERGILLLPERLRGEVGTLTLAISDEPEGGSPTGTPTGEILATGAVVSL